MTDRLEFQVVVRRGSHGLIDIGGYDIAADQVPDIVDNQIQAVGRQVADGVGQTGDNQMGDDAGFENGPGTEYQQCRNTAPHGGQQAVICRARMHLRQTGTTARHR